jgi:uncharacterized Zn finger protein
MSNARPDLTEAAIRERTAGGSFERGERYFENDAVKRVTVHPDDGELKAQVQGSETLPYTVTVAYTEEGGVEEAECTCPYHAGSWCKHIVATLLAYLRNRQEHTSRLASLLDDLDRDQLASLVERLAERDERVVGWIEEERGA